MLLLLEFIVDVIFLKLKNSGKIKNYKITKMSKFKIFEINKLKSTLNFILLLIVLKRLLLRYF